MESRIKLLENRVTEMTLEKQAISSTIKEIYGSYSKIQPEARSESKNLYKKRDDKMV